jgi:hypothetical protein
VARVRTGLSRSAALQLLALASLWASPACHGEREEQARCARSHPHPPLAACVLSSSNKALPEGRLGLQLSGTVLDFGVGQPPENCDAEGLVIGHYSVDPADASTKRWLRIESGAGQRALVVVAAPGFELAAKKAEVISIDFYMRARSFGRPPMGALLLRRADHSLVTWLAADNSLATLEPPNELSLAAGRVACTASNSCFPSWTRNALKVTSSAGTKEIAYGARATLGNLELVHGGLDVATSHVTKCTDGSMDWVAVAAWD